MARRRLSPDEVAVWGRVAATVKPLAGRGSVMTKLPPVRAEPVEAFPFPFVAAPAKRREAFDRLSPNGILAIAVAKPNPHTLDANWDKRLATGKASPDTTIDLHGHTVASAHALLNHALGDAIRSGARVVLLITGRPARDNPRMPPTGRGVIRASVEDWLTAGPHASRIAAIRKAHMRHGGAGALYLVLRRDRG